MTTRITARFVVGFDGLDHVIYPGGEVVYDGGAIIFAGRGYAGPVDETIDAGDAIVGPGFIDLNALGDIDHAILDSWVPAETYRGLQWSEAYFRAGRQTVFTRADEAFKRRYALVQLILNGVTTAMPIASETYRAWAETYEEFADTAAIAGALGLRMFMGPSYRSGVNVTRADGVRDVLFDEAQGREGLRQAAAFIRDFDGAHGGRIRGALVPARIETCTPELLRETARLAAEFDCPVRMHAGQSQIELRLTYEKHGLRTVRYLQSLGLLGPKRLIAHAAYIGGHSEVDFPYDGELELLAQSGTTVIYCPLASARYGMRLETLERFQQAGVNIALGSDTFPPDIIRVMDLGSNMAKIIAGDSTAGAAADLYRAATLGGARALGRDDLGRLAPGARADITIVDLSPLRTGVIDDPIRTLLMNSGGAHVRTVIVDGRVIMRDGRIPGVDADAMRAQAEAYFAKYRAAYTERDYRHRSPDELFPSSFRIIR